MSRQKVQRGFTLIELMIVVVIIGIVAAFVIPRFMASTTVSKQAEAKQTLQQIYVMEHAYYQECGEYWGDDKTADRENADEFSRIGVHLASDARYSYTIVCDATTYLVTATANLDDDPALDEWTIDQNGNLVCVSDDSSL